MPGRVDKRCLDCKQDRGWEHDYMVKDEVWQAASCPDEGYVCLACLAKRLDREITTEDLTPDRVNEPIRMIFSLLKEVTMLRHQVSDQ